MASKLSGVTELSIRAWEGRYAAISPKRTDTNRRMYSDSDIEKLTILRKLTENGHRIGNLANLELEELKKTLEKTEIQLSSLNVSNTKSLSNELQRIIMDCIESIKEYDEKGLGSSLSNASVTYTRPDLIDKIILPLIETIGRYWQEGYLRISHEHFASSYIRRFMENLTESFQSTEASPRLIVTTPEGQYHEVGAIIGAALAASDGWKTTYLGASLPAEDIAAAANKLNSRCILLSIVYPNDSLEINAQIIKLRKLAGDGIYIIANGSAVNGYRKTLADINAFVSENPEHFRSILSEIREKINPNNI